MKLVKSTGSDDWYLIEHAEHEGKVWFEPTQYGQRYMTSARVSDADVEGTADQMRAIAAAIRARGEYSAKRCAVEIVGNSALFRSPRNSLRDGLVSLEDADDLAGQIERELGVEPALNPLGTR